MPADWGRAASTRRPPPLAECPASAAAWAACGNPAEGSKKIFTAASPTRRARPTSTPTSVRIHRPAPLFIIFRSFNPHSTHPPPPLLLVSLLLSGLYGQVVDCVIMCDPHTRKPRGFGFVTYDTTQAVDRACMTKFHELNGTRHKPSAPRPLPPSSTFPLVLLSRPSFFPTLSGKRVEVKRAIPQDRMAAEDGGMGGMKPNDPNVLAALAGGLFPGGMQGLGGGGQPGANGYPASLLQGLQGGNGQGGGNGAGGWPGQTPDTTQQGLDAAISAANSVLGSMTEPPQQDTTKSQVPSGILNAFNNPTGNFSTASAALSNGARTGYNGNNNEQQGPTSGGNGGGGGGADVSTGAQAEAQAQAMINIQAQQLASQQQQQQQQFQSTLLQFQQQQLLLQQMQQRQRQQQQLQQLEQLQKLQQALLTTGPAQTAAATATMPTMEPLPGGAMVPRQRRRQRVRALRSRRPPSSSRSGCSQWRLRRMVSATHPLRRPMAPTPLLTARRRLRANRRAPTRRPSQALTRATTDRPL